MFLNVFVLGFLGVFVFVFLSVCVFVSEFVCVLLFGVCPYFYVYMKHYPKTIKTTSEGYLITYDRIMNLIHELLLRIMI